jgi:hypothetical protein
MLLYLNSSDSDVTHASPINDMSESSFHKVADEFLDHVEEAMGKLEENEGIEEDFDVSNSVRSLWVVLFVWSSVTHYNYSLYPLFKT